jgi:hypothetical protein
MGLAHNHPWLYNHDRNCPLCQNGIETEQHLLLTCTTLQVERALLQMSFDWYIRQHGESQEAWLHRMILKGDLTELAKILLSLRNTRRKMLIRLGYTPAPFMI